MLTLGEKLLFHEMAMSMRTLNVLWNHMCHLCTFLQPEKAFFGDGLFDLAAERDEEAVAYAETVRR